MIELRDVTKIYNVQRGVTVTAVRDVSLRVEAGEFVVITGRSGSGKTTILNLVAGLTRPSAGAVCVDGLDIWSMPDKAQSALRNRTIGFIFQFPSLLPSLTVLENVVLPTTFSSLDGHLSSHDRARRILETVGLSDKVAVYPCQLSAGQQQRVVIARALINRPSIVLADEATSNLDEQTEREIMALLQKIHDETGITILMVSHTAQLASYGTRGIEMAQGAIVRDANRSVSLASPVPADMAAV
jgi:ABC-type lipoprotein export system ATPase subunit